MIAFLFFFISIFLFLSHSARPDSRGQRRTTREALILSSCIFSVGSGFCFFKNKKQKKKQVKTLRSQFYLFIFSLGRSSRRVALLSNQLSSLRALV